jgi:beta-glucosidase
MPYFNLVERFVSPYRRFRAIQALVEREIDLPGIAIVPVRQVIATGTPTVVVVQSGRPLVFGAEAKGAAAVLWTAFSGQQGGTALAEILFGKVNPSAKLTMTFPRALGQIPIRYWHHPQKNWDHETYGQRYLDLEDEPAYPFGHGLSYTNFKYSGVKVEILPPDRVRVSFNVTNSGTRSGTETAQVYLVDEVGSHTPWSQRLVRFARIDLEPGETKPVSFDLSPADLAAWNGKERVLEPGSFQVMIGSSSTDTPLKRRFSIGTTR